MKRICIMWLVVMTLAGCEKTYEINYPDATVLKYVTDDGKKIDAYNEDSYLTLWKVLNHYFSDGEWHIVFSVAPTDVPFAAFSSSHLVSIELPESITSISGAAFRNSKLTTITLPAKVTSIGEQAFANTSLETVRCEASVPPRMGKNVFDGIKNLTIYVPAASVSYYQHADGWPTDFSYIGF